MSNKDDEYTTYEMTGDNPTEDVHGSYLLVMEMMKLFSRIHNENNIITSVDIKFCTKRDFEHTANITSIPLTVNTHEPNKPDEVVYNDLNELMERWFNIDNKTLTNFMYRSFVMQFAEICRKDINKVLVGAGVNDNFLYVDTVNSILKEYNVPFCVHENLKGVQFVIMRTKWK